MANMRVGMSTQLSLPHSAVANTITCTVATATAARQLTHVMSLRIASSHTGAAAPPPSPPLAPPFAFLRLLRPLPDVPPLASSDSLPLGAGGGFTE